MRYMPLQIFYGHFAGTLLSQLRERQVGQGKSGGKTAKNGGKTANEIYVHEMQARLVFKKGDTPAEMPATGLRK